MAHRNNTPTADLATIPEEFTALTVSSLKELNALGQPRSDAEVTQRIDQYFTFCGQHNLRPGIESLALALHVSRQTIYLWGKGINCSVERQQTIENAKQFIASFIEQAGMSGKLNPVTTIFLMKNWMGYQDAYALESSVSETRDTQPSEDLQSIRTRYSKLTDNDTDSDL